MEILYKLEDFPEPGDRDLYNGIQEINKNNYQEAFKHFEKGSNYSNEYASLFHAMLYFTGFGFTKRDPAKAMNLFKKIAVEWNNPVAQYLIGVMYMDGDKGISQHNKYAIHWLSLAADNGWSDAMAYLATAYLVGRLTKEDNKKAFELLEKVSKKDDNETGLIDDGIIYLFGNKDFEINMNFAEMQALIILSSITNCRKASPVSLLGHSDSLLDHFFDSEMKSTVFWNLLTNKKSSGVAECQLLLATLLVSGKADIPIDKHRSTHWLKKAAKNKNANACMILAKMYEYGLGLSKDYKEALKWYKAANELGGDAESAYRIGVFYYNEWGVESNCKLALSYFKERVSHSDHGPSFIFMGDIYENGKDGVTQDYQKAHECFEKAYQCGEVRATYALGKLYYLGLGVEVDEKKARQWFNKASTMKVSSSPAPPGFFGLFLMFAQEGLFK